MRTILHVSIVMLLVVTFLPLPCNAETMPIKLRSPNEQVEIKLSLSAEGVPVYSVGYKGRIIIIDSVLGIEFNKEGLLQEGLTVTRIERNSYDEMYAVVAGKSSHARNHSNEMVVSFVEDKPPKRQIDVAFRAYDDGVAFQYVIPTQEAMRDFEIMSERSEFSFSGNHTCWASRVEGANTFYERAFKKLSINDIKSNEVVVLPLTIQIENGPTVAISEAGLADYAGMYITGNEGKDNTLVSRLAPLPERGGVSVKAAASHSSPWRVIMIGDSPGDLIESNIIPNLNAPCALADTSWIKPGKAAWPWWSGRVVTGVDFEGGMNTATMKHYVNFAAANSLDYLLIDAEWYGNQRDPSVDITTTIPEIDLPEIIKYAKKRNVDVLLWLNWENTRNQMDEAFPLYEQWGVKGVKIDFMNRDDQEMVGFYLSVVKKAAEHHLIVDFHGAYKPAGIRRTYPNLITREGVMGLEYAKWSKRITPEHNVTIPFTRMLAGPMDYTPGGFNNVTSEQFKPQRKAPMTMGTRCHQLAMFVVYESPLQMVFDYPGAYHGQEEAEFLRVVPASWDETRVLAGEIGEYIAIARRRGKDWFIGAMSNSTERNLEFPLSFLNSGEYKAKIYADGADAATNPRQVAITELNVTAASKLAAHFAAGGGGFAAFITPAE